MSDTISKWYENNDETTNLINNIPPVRYINNYIPTPEEVKEAYTILTKYSTAAIIEAARIAKTKQ
tara:strand:- start:3024 stop:3218 length:195 start_codon:yes stop_codon:yes gene_type:complete